jgi:Tetracyclin repressor-like, C-terminal domain
MIRSEKIKKAYIEYILEEGHQPASVFAFAKKLKMKENEFYQEFASFTIIESKIWVDFLEETIAKMESEPVFENYSAREKILSFYFTWIEVLKENRSYALKFFEKDKRQLMKDANNLKDFKEAFKDYMDKIMIEGIENREIEQRPFISERYSSVIYAQALFITDFWIKDGSENFEKTDTLIEKSVNTAFDLMGKSPLDSMFDLAKFVFQNRA